jgi:6-phosphogluconolactonase
MVSVALAGGSTPRRVYADLAAQPNVAWEKVRIFFGDERAVAPEHPDSNYRMARETLLSRVPIPDAQIFRMHAESPDRDAAAVAYAAVLPDRLDLLILGVGSDGHTASLFPGSLAVRETVRTVVPALGPDPPRARLTITRAVIARARQTVVLAAGKDKAAAVRRALKGLDDVEACPAQLARHGVWILDTGAAIEL